MGYFSILLATLMGTFLLQISGSELFPEDPSDQLIYALEFKPGSTQKIISTQVKALEKVLVLNPIVQGTISTIGLEPGLVHQIFVRLKKNPDAQELRSINKAFASIPDLEFKRKKIAIVTDAKPVRIEMYSEKIPELKQAVFKVKNLLDKIPELIDLETSQKPDLKEISIDFSRAKLGLFEMDPMQYVSSLKSFLRGFDVGTATFEGKSLAMKIETRSNAFDSFDKIKYFQTESESGSKIFLSQIANVEEKILAGSVLHHGKKRFAFVEANLAYGDPDKINKLAQKALIGEFKESPVEWKITGQEEERKENAKNFFIAIGFSLFLIYLMLASQFESLVQPFVVLSAVPLCISGVGVFLFLFQLKISALVFVGFIILIGSSVNTSIVMVDFANQLRATGESIKSAIIKSTGKRMKPILVTTLSNLFGLIPMAFSAGEAGSAMQQPLAVTILGGLLSSTVLTLVVVPYVYVKFSKNE